MIRFVIATRENEADFFTRTALGRSLRTYIKYKPLFEVRVFANNTAGLPSIYNRAISETSGAPRTLVFAHDDIHLCDLFWPTHVEEALRTFDIAGVAGNKSRVANQPSWALVFSGQSIVWDEADNLSGAVGHGSGFPPQQIDIYGPSRQEVKLLDGLMLIANSQTLHEQELRFDEQFDFHFYDLDFCRQAELKGLKMGTWPISLVHESEGNFHGESWRTGLANYLAKWKS